MLSSAIVFSFGLVGLRKLNLTGDFDGLHHQQPDLHHFRGLYLSAHEIRVIFNYWGKADPNYPGEPKWYPPGYHCLDVAAVDCQRRPMWVGDV
jgi:hypothetical protein